MSFQRFAGRLFLVLSALFLAVPAAADDLFTVEGVEVDVEAADAAQARDAAVALAQSRALRRLWQRFVPEEHLGQVPELSAERVASLVEDYRVVDERSGAKSYRGELNVRFFPGEVRRFLRDANVPYAEQEGPTLLVLPVLADDQGTRLWDDPNPWRDAWGRRSDVGLLPVEVPLGDLSDITSIDAEQAVALDRGALDAISSVYDVEDVLVAVAQVQGDPETGDAGLSIELRRIGPDHDGGMEMESLRQQEDEPADRFYERAVEVVDERVQTEWKRANALSFSDQRELLVRVPVEGLESWVELRRGLQDTARVVDHDILSLSRGEGVLSIFYVGDEEDLARTLARSNLVLEEAPPERAGMPEWRLALAPGERLPGRRGDAAQPRASEGEVAPDTSLDSQ